MDSISLTGGQRIFVDSDVAHEIAWSVATLSRHSVENAVLGRNIPVVDRWLGEVYNRHYWTWKLDRCPERGLSQTVTGSDFFYATTD